MKYTSVEDFLYLQHFKPVLTIVSVFAFTVSFIPLHRIFGDPVGVLMVGPAMIISYLYGMRTGLISGVGLTALSLLLFMIVTPPEQYLHLWDPALFGFIMVMLVSGSVGHIGDMTRKLRREIADQERHQKLW